MDKTENKIYKYFKKNELSECKSVYYRFISRCKLVTYIPYKHLDKLTFDLSNCGAGKIGNYDLCSFRFKGIGTYRPVKGANPYQGKLNEFTMEEEARLEMEFDGKDKNKIVDTLLANHPYDEVAYEIYEFVKREKEPSGFLIRFKSKKTYKEIFTKFNKKIETGFVISRRLIKKIIYATGKITKEEITEFKKKYKPDIITVELENKIQIINK
jgi:hypothetical protein